MRQYIIHIGCALLLVASAPITANTPSFLQSLFQNVGQLFGQNTEQPSNTLEPQPQYNDNNESKDVTLGELFDQIDKSYSKEINSRTWNKYCKESLREKIGVIYNFPEELEVTAWRYTANQHDYNNEIVVGISHGTFARDSGEYTDPEHGEVLAPILRQFGDKANNQNPQKNVTIFVFSWSGRNRDADRTTFGQRKAAFYNGLPNTYTVYDINHSHACNASFVMMHYLKKYIEHVICFNPPVRGEYIEYIKNNKNNNYVGHLDIFAAEHDWVVPWGHIHAPNILTGLYSLFNAGASKRDTTSTIHKPVPGTELVSIWLHDFKFGHSNTKSYIVPHLLEMCEQIEHNHPVNQQRLSDNPYSGSRSEYIVKEDQTEKPYLQQGTGYSSSLKCRLQHIGTAALQIGPYYLQKLIGNNKRANNLMMGIGSATLLATPCIGYLTNWFRNLRP